MKQIIFRSVITLVTVIFLFPGNCLFAQDPYDGGESEQVNGKITWPDNKKVAVSLTFDDARLSQVDTGIPLFDKYGVKATFYVTPSLMMERLDEWKKAAENGHEIGNHTNSHPCTGNFTWSQNKALELKTLRDISLDIQEANLVIEEAFGNQPISFAYPCGQKYVGQGDSYQSYVPLINDLFVTGRGWMNEGPNDPIFCDLAQLTGMESDGKDFEYIKTLIENAAESGAWLVLAGHEIGEPGVQTTRTSTLEALCKYASDPANGVWIAPVGTIGEYLANHPERKLMRSKEIYLDPSVPIETRVEDLLSRMTLAEKIGQLNMPVLYSSELGSNTEEKMEGSRKFSRGELIEGIGPGGGFFTMANHILREGPAQQASFFNELQKIAVDQTRLKIPLLQTEEGTHGLMCTGGTIFPEGHAIGSSWNTNLVNDIYTIAAREGRAVGIHELFTLVIEPNRDPRLGRNIEGFSEDPYLCSRYAETIVRAVQGDDLTRADKTVAGLCHFPGQSQPESGLERGAMEISERILREVFLPPYEAGIKKAGAMGVMATYPTIDGIPIHSSSKILTDVLRGELGFEGLVLSEGNGVNTLVYTGIAKDEKDAGAMAANAGMDVSISFEQGYFTELVESVNEGKVSMATIDRSVRRVLLTKFMLGLFENPFVSVDKAVKIVNQEDHQKVALQAAREGIVLLKNENNILPLKKNLKSIAIIGPNADDEKNQLGDYTSYVVLQDIITTLDGIKSSVSSGTKVTYVKGCDVIGNDVNEISKAVKAAKSAEVAVVVVGENEWQNVDHKGTTGEGYDVATLELTGMQRELIKRVHATGTPTVVVLINGRPLAIPWIAENVPAIVEAWCPGEKGGQAVAEILFGDYNPGGKLPSTFPKHAGQLPVFYNHKPSKPYWLNKGWGNSYVDMAKKPLYEFGYGLSYTTYDYSDLKISPTKHGTGGSINVEMSVKNTGSKEGDEIVQLYIRDVQSSVVRPVKELKGFEKVHLKPGESVIVNFELTPEHLSMYDRDMNRIVEPGIFSVMVGSSSEKIHLEGEFEIVGD